MKLQPTRRPTPLLGFANCHSKLSQLFVRFSFLPLFILLCSASIGLAAPANDNIANATLLSGSTAADTVDNTTATKQVGDFAEKTVWWKWTAPANGVATFDAVNSVPNYIKMAIYLQASGGGLGATVYVSSASFSTPPKYVFPVAQGTTYMIGLGNQSTNYFGVLHLGLSLNTSTSIGNLAVVGPATMTNDAFAQRITLSGTSPGAICYPTSASNEAGEPSTSGVGTFWFTYRPAVNGRLTLTSQGSTASYAEIAAYLGTTVSGLRMVSYQSNYSLVNFTFPVTAGADYQISIGTTGTGSQSDALVLGLSLDTQADVSSLITPVPATMSNDNFAGRISLVGDAVGAIAYNSSATTEAGEPSYSGNGTFWWTYRPSATGRLTITSQGSDIGYADVAVYQGTSLSNLSLVAGQSNYSGVNFSFPVTANTDYQISFGTSTTGYGTVGSMVLGLNLNKNADVSLLNIPQPASALNDNFVNRIALTGNQVSTIGYNPAATREALEPTTTYEKTLWWSWTAGATGTAQLDFTGSDANVNSYGKVSVWQGSSVSALTNVTIVTGLRFAVVSGQTYQIAVGTSNTSYSGSIVMTVTGPPSPAQVLTPAPGATFASTIGTFTWDSGAGVTSYSLWVGSAPGGYDVYSGNEGTNRSRTVTLPDDGRPLYVTLFSLISGVYQSKAYTYTAYRGPGPVKAQITSPVNGSTLGSTTLPLVWNAGTSVTSYYLFVGTTPGGYDLYAGDQGTALSRSVNVPAGGGKVHVTLWSLIKGAYQSNKYVFTTVASDKAALVGPTNGSTLTGNSLNLSWTAGTGVSRYYIYVGSTYGGYDIAAVDAGTANAWNLIVPQDGGPVYVTLWSLINGGFQANNYWFTTALPPSGNRPARITSPANASTLGSATMNLAWDAGSGASSYALWVGSTPDGYDLYSGLEGSSLSKSVPIPGDGRRIYVTLHSLISGAYQSNSYFFTAPTLPDGGAAQITSPANGSTLANSSLTLTWGAAAGATQYYLFAGSMPGGSDLYSGNQGTNLTYTLNGMPIDGRAIYVTLYSLINGVYKQSSTYYKTSNTASGNRRALITSPANGSTLPGAANTFTWGGGSGVTSYALWIGSSPGAYDLWSSAETLATTSRSVTLPTDGRKIHVTLYSFISGAWQGASYIYTAANVAPTKAAMTSPVNGTTFTSASQTFTWSPSNAATMYALWIGRSPGAYDIYAGAEGTNTSRTVTTLPTDGSPVYVTLHSLINGAWQSSEYIYSSWLQP